MIQLPLKIEKSITEILSRVEQNTWTKSALRLSAKYRLNRSMMDEQEDRFVEGSDEVFGYLALRATATYAQLHGAMSHIFKLIPNWQPTSILDIGSGPGTAVWAARELWPEINTITCLEKDDNFSKIGKEILKDNLEKSVVINWKTIDLSLSKPEIETKYDLVTIGSVLNEMTQDQQKNILEFANDHCRCVLLVVEPGTPKGFEVIKHTSLYLRTQTGILLAPYINNGLVTSTLDQIGFGQSITRPQFLKRIRQMQRKLSSTKDKPLLPASDWEEAKYTYVASSVLPAQISPWARLVAKPVMAKAYIELKILTKDKVSTIKVLKSDKVVYKVIKRMKWGDLIDSGLRGIVRS